MTPSLTFIVPVRNDPERLRRCLFSIQRVTAGQQIAVIVIDNGSTDETPHVAAAHGAEVLSRPGLRVGELRNHGAAAATGELLAFIDADHELLPGWYESAISAFRDPSVGAAGALCHPPPDGTWVQHAYDTLRDHSAGLRDVEWLGAGNMVVRRSAFYAVGGFDRALEACEDVDLCRALLAAGWQIKNDSRMRNVHYGDPQTLRRHFVSELWRGRNNATVSLRAPVQLRSCVSLAHAVVQLGAMITLATGASAVAFLPRAAGPLMISGSLAFLAPSAVRILRMYRRVTAPSVRRLWDVVRVAITYDCARALALVYPARHHRA